VPRVEPAAPRLAPDLAQPSSVALDDGDELQDALLVGTDLTGTVAPDAHVAGCELRDARLTGADLEGAVLTDVSFVGCDLSGAIFTEAQWLRVELRNCRASGLVVAQARLRDVRWVGSKLDGLNARLVRGERVVFEDCSLVDADFYETTLEGGAFDDCDLVTANFAAARLSDVRFRHSRLERLRGAGGMRGAAVSAEQTLPLALSLFADLGISLLDDESPDDEAGRTGARGG
jgi:uncharacterized protein YjbI with pentapeptide repeats